MLTRYYQSSCVRLSVPPAVCLSATRRSGIVLKGLNVESLNQRHVIAQGLYFLTPTVVGGRLPKLYEICAQSDPHTYKRNNFDQYLLMELKPWELAKNVQLALIGSRPRAFQPAMDDPCTLPLSPPKGSTKCDFVVFSSRIQILSKEVCYKVFLCKNFKQLSCGYIISLSNGP